MHERGHQMVTEFVHHQPSVTKYKLCHAEKDEHMKERTFFLWLIENMFLMKQPEAEPSQQNTFIPQGQNRGDLIRSVESYRDTGRAGWGPARWPTERAAEALAPALPLSVRHADCLRHLRLLCESPPGKQKAKIFSDTNSCLDSVL